MTCIEFCKKFDCYIAFNRLGEGQIFGTGEPPKLMKSNDFWLPTKGGDCNLLPCLVSDYEKYSKQFRAILLSKDSKEQVEEEIHKVEVNEHGEKIFNIMSSDFKENDEINLEVTVDRVIGWPDTASSKPDTWVHRIRFFDGKHHFIWDTRAKDYPKEGEKKILKATIKESTESREWDVPAYNILGVKLLIPKK